MKYLAALLFLSSFAMAQASPCTPPQVPIVSGLTTTTYIDTTVVDNVTYYYTVAAFNANESTCSNVATAFVPATGTHTVTLNWTASTTSGVTYAVFRAVPPAPPTSLTVTVN
jgi:hypothetical protein